MFKFIYIIFQSYFDLIKEKINLLNPRKKALSKKRLDICFRCSHLSNKICNLCGCYVPAKVQADYDLDENGKSINGCPKSMW